MNRSIPTPTLSQISVGPFTIHFYALCIIAGIGVAIWLGNKRFAAHDKSLQGVVSEVAVIAVPSGIVGREDLEFGALSHLAHLELFFRTADLQNRSNFQVLEFSLTRSRRGFYLLKLLEDLEIGLTPNSSEAHLTLGGASLFPIKIARVVTALSKLSIPPFYTKRSGARF